MLRGTTTSGFEFEIDETKLDNMEFLDAIAEVEENAIAISKVIKMMFTPKEKNKLYDHLRTEDGRVPVDAMGREIGEIMRIASEVSTEIKNS